MSAVAHKSARVFGSEGHALARSRAARAENACPPRVSRGAKSHHPSDNAETRDDLSSRIASRACLIDWLTFSGPDGQRGAVADMLTALFGADPVVGSGGKFQSCGMKWGAAKLLYSPECEEPDARCIVEVPGEALASLTEAKILTLLRAILSMGFRATRLDVAIDFMGEGIDLIDRVYVSCEAGELTGARRWSLVGDCRTDLGLVGKGLYLGRRGKLGSGRTVCVYDKGLQQRTDEATGRAYAEGEWVRWEARFSKDCANQAALLISELDDWRPEGLSMALGAIDLRENTGRRDIERRPRVAWWEAFLADVSLIRLVAKRVKTTLARWKGWMGTQVMPGVKAMAGAFGVTFSDLIDRVVGDVPHSSGALASDVYMQLRSEWAYYSGRKERPCLAPF